MDILQSFHPQQTKFMGLIGARNHEQDGPVHSIHFLEMFPVIQISGNVRILGSTGN